MKPARPLQQMKPYSVVGEDVHVALT
jgi:hypothetical protein